MATKNTFNKHIEKFAVIFSFILWGGLTVLGVLSRFEYKIYDILLGLTKSPKESDSILLVDVDDLALGNMGPWPWPRNIIAEQLVSMRELGASQVIFDIEYLSDSQKTLNQEVLDKVMEDPEHNAALLRNVYQDNDDYFAKTIEFFGNTWLTINAENLAIPYTDEELQYAEKRFLIPIDDQRKNKVIKPYSEFSPAKYNFISRASGAGFTNAKMDSDGTRRRNKILEVYPDGAAGELSFAPLLSIIQPESIILKDRSVTLKNALLPDAEEREDITIPLDENGYMLIHWLHKDFIGVDETGAVDPSNTSFNQSSIYWLWCMNYYEKAISNNLASLNALGDCSFTQSATYPVAFTNKTASLYSDSRDIQDFRDYLLSGCDGYAADGTPFTPQDKDTYDQYFDFRRGFFSDVQAFAESGLADELGEYINENFTDLTDDDIEQISKAMTAAEELKENIGNYLMLFDGLREIYSGKICFIGNTGTATTDLGTTPFNSGYPNLGTHANIMNTILQKDFIYPVDFYYPIIFATLMSLLLLTLCKKAKVGLQNVVGIALILMMIVIPVAFMVTLGVYIPVLGAVLITLTSYVIVTIFKLVNSEKDKKFLQTTFGAYVAPAVVDQIVKDPSIAKLGGKSDTLTALFSDVKTFSRYTEVINNKYGEEHGAEQLVATLNAYLGVLSDAIMENAGTIDKYVGDEIVSFFGAPVHDENNAYNACVAAIRMREAEDKYNIEHEADLPINPATGKPYYLHSRIGLNTGNMVVGNMGTEKKLNYTIMGNNVNLASRLEGTNNAYGSWVMCSESTWSSANSGENKGKIIVREFDYVRVINVKKPVRIYNILGLRDEMAPDRLKAAETFNEGIKWYLKGCETPELKKDPADLIKAKEFFRKADELYPDDGSSKVFIARCDEFLTQGFPEQWDGVYTMKSK